MASTEPGLRPKLSCGSVFPWLSVALVAFGWSAVVAGVIYAGSAREYVDACGQPADLPGTAGFFFGGVACLSASFAFGMAMWLNTHHTWPHATKVIVAGVLLGPSGGLLAAWVLLSHLRLCF